MPAAVKSKGKILVAADASYPPNEFVAADGKTIQGMDADLAQALAQVLGINAELVNSPFDSIIPGLQANKYDIAMSSMTDTKEREKTIDFVTYFNAGTSFFTKSSGGADIQTIDDLCGHHVAVESGTTQQDDAKAQTTKCTGAGKPAVDVQIFNDQNAANLALTSGRADIVMVDQPVADYQVKQSNGAFKPTGKTYGQAPYGIALPKGSALAQPLLDALKVLIDNGTYKQILDKWGIASGAISAPQINGATG